MRTEAKNIEINIRHDGKRSTLNTGQCNRILCNSIHHRSKSLHDLYKNVQYLEEKELTPWYYLMCHSSNINHL